MYKTMIINTITSREDRATITAIIGVSSEGGKASGVVAAVLEFPSQGSVLASVNWLSGSHVSFGKIVVPIELVLAVLVVPLSESEELTVVK